VCWPTCRRRVRAIAFVQVGEEELLEKALKRFKRMVEKEGIVREWKRREYFEKPSTVRNKRRKAMERKRMKKLRKIQSQLKS
jgi:small subunit ribosomal protein S21